MNQNSKCLGGQSSSFDILIISIEFIEYTLILFDSNNIKIKVSFVSTIKYINNIIYDVQSNKSTF